MTKIKIIKVLIMISVIILINVGLILIWTAGDFADNLYDYDYDYSNYESEAMISGMFFNRTVLGSILLIAGFVGLHKYFIKKYM